MGTVLRMSLMSVLSCLSLMKHINAWKAESDCLHHLINIVVLTCGLVIPFPFDVVISRLIIVITGESDHC